MRRAVVLLAAVLLFAGCGGDEEPNAQPGNAAVYERIAATTDCAALQGEFDTAMENLEREDAGTDRYTAVLSYAKAAEDRRTELGC